MVITAPSLTAEEEGHHRHNDKMLGLVHISAAYDWHRGNWTIGPTATIDFIKGGHQTYYLGLAVGYGF